MTAGVGVEVGVGAKTTSMTTLGWGVLLKRNLQLKRGLMVTVEVAVEVAAVLVVAAVVAAVAAVVVAPAVQAVIATLVLVVDVTML
jgi:hypothetical protein